MTVDSRHCLKGLRGSIEVDLSDEEAGKLGNNPQYHLFEIGFLGEDRIKAYDCGECGNHYEGSPKKSEFI